MIDQQLAGKTIAILVASGFEETEMTEPQRGLLAAGATMKVVSHEQGLVNGWLGKAWGHYFPVDVPLSAALAADFDAVLVPGGFRSVEKLQGVAHTQRFLRGFADAGKPMAVCGKAIALLASAERLQGRTVAAASESKDEAAAAGAILSTDPLVTDRNLITVADEYDMEGLKRAIVETFTEVTENLAAAA